MRAAALATSLALTISLAACQGVDPTSPEDARGLDLTARGTIPATVELSGGFWTPGPQPGTLRTTAGFVEFLTTPNSPVPTGLNVDQDGGSLGVDQLPVSGQIDWAHCSWNSDIAYPYDPSNVPPFAKQLWDTFMTTYAPLMPRHLSIRVDTNGLGAPDPEHSAVARWLASEGGQKYLWEFEVGAEPPLSLVLPVASWDGQTATFSQGVVRLTRMHCGTFVGPLGCTGRVQGSKPTVVCRNDGLAYPGATFTARVQQ
jgi:hypothetical protein